MPYCAYLRKSRADYDIEARGEEETLARHRRLLTELSNNLHIQISRFYSEVVSGDTISDRPVIRQLLSDVEAGLWEGVFVVEIERLARGSTRDQGIVADTFKYAGAKIITPAKTYDPNDEFDEEYFEFGLFMSRREYKTINRRLQRGRTASVQEGKFVNSTAPYGYRRVKLPHEKGYTLEIDGNEAWVVKFIFDLYCNGEIRPDGSSRRYSLAAVAEKLNAMGIPPSRSEKWSRSTVSGILDNPTYSGFVSFGRKKQSRQSVDGRIRVCRKNSDDFILTKGLHPPIIDSHTFEAVKRMRRENRRSTAPLKTSLQNPLSGLIYCKTCGALMTRLAPNARHNYAVLACPTRSCGNISCPLSLIETNLLLFLKDWLAAYETTPIQHTAYGWDKELRLKQSAAGKQRAELSSLSKQIERAHTLLEQGVYTADTFVQRRDLLNQKIAAASEYLSSLQEEINSLETLRSHSEPQAICLLHTYKTNRPEVNNRLLKELVHKVLYEKNGRCARGKLLNADFSLTVFPNVPKDF